MGDIYLYPGGKRLDEKQEMEEPFVPETGNPENGNYLDYYDHMKKNGTLVTSKTPFTTK